jgi:hypothetical protein
MRDECKQLASIACSPVASSDSPACKLKAQLWPMRLKRADRLAAFSPRSPQPDLEGADQYRNFGLFRVHGVESSQITCSGFC